MGCVVGGEAWGWVSLGAPKESRRERRGLMRPDRDPSETRPTDLEVPRRVTGTELTGVKRN